MSPKEMFYKILSNKTKEVNWYVICSLFDLNQCRDVDFKIDYFSDDKVMYYYENGKNTIYVILDFYEYFDRELHPLSFLRNDVHFMQAIVYDNEYKAIDRNITYRKS